MIRDFWYTVGTNSAFGFSVGVTLGTALVGVVFFTSEVIRKWRGRNGMTQREEQAKAAAELILKLLHSSARLNDDERQILCSAGLVLGAIVAGER